MLGFKDVHCTAKIVDGIELRHMIRKSQRPRARPFSSPMWMTGTSWQQPLPVTRTAS